MDTTSHLKPLPDLAHEGPIARGTALLRLLASAGRRGAGLTELAQRTNLAHSTVHRLLAQLLKQRLAMQREGTHFYAIGPLAYELGLVAAQQFDIRALCRPVMERLAAESKEAVYFVQRSGSEAVCIDVIESQGNARILTLRSGSRRPLGLGAGGLAILSSLPSEEREEILVAVAGTIERYWRIPEAEIRRSLKEVRSSGFAVIRNTVTPGVTAIGRSFRDSLNQVFGALTVAGLSGQMTTKRLNGLRQSLDRATSSVEELLQSRQWSLFSAQR